LNPPCVIVLCGGRGTRLWPMCRSDLPKYLLDVSDEGTLLGATLRRASRLTDPERIVVVTSEQHRDAAGEVAKRFGVSAFATEPSPRDTTAAALLGVREIERRWGASRVFSLPADHEVGDVDAWVAAMQVAATAPPDRIATVGIRPTAPSVEYGYIEAAGSGEERIPVARFHEKPTRDLALEYFDKGGYLWNTAMMSFTTTGFLEALSIAARDLIDHVDRAGTPGALDPDAWSSVPSIALEHSLMEPAASAGLVDVVPAEFGWRDLGTWTELSSLLPRSGAVVSTEIDTQVVTPFGAVDRRYVNVGVPGLIIVDTGDVLLVTTASAASRVKEAVVLAQSAGWKDVL
jgi:mannose-1-phosphate guanylyltransferase